MLKKYDSIQCPPFGRNSTRACSCFRVYRVNFLRAGVPLEKIDVFCDILEESSLRLTSSQRMRELVSFIRQQEAKELMEEINEKS